MKKIPDTEADRPYTSKEILEIRGVVIFIAVITATSSLGILFQLISGHNATVILPSLFLYSLAVILALRLYSRKKKRQNTDIHASIIGLIMLTIPVIARYNYTVEIDWFYAAQCAHLNWLLMANLIAFQFLYNKRLYRIMILYVLANFVLFFYLAWLNGVPMPFNTFNDGKIHYGILSSKELYTLLMMAIVSYLSYTNIPEIEKYDRITTEQSALILKQLENEALITQEVRAQYEELEAQYEEIGQMNEEMTHAQDEIMLVNADLRKEKNKLATTLKSISVGIITLNNTLKVESINDGACSILDIEPDAVRGKSIGEAFEVRGPAGEPFILSDSAFLSGNLSLDINNPGIIKRGNCIAEVTLKSSPIQGREEERPGYVIVIEDVTETKKMKDQMINASKLESIGVFAGGIAHDINNFFTGMIGCIALAKNDPSVAANASVNKYLSDAESTAFMAKGLAEQLLTFARGGEPLKKLVSLKDILSRSVDFVLSGKSVICEKQIQHDLLNIEADRAQIAQVINNLLINALQAMPAGGRIYLRAFNIDLEINNRSNLPPGKYVATEIEDEGPGIDRSIIKNIFDPFFTTKSKGSGLGLSVAYSVLNRHGGIITAGSGERGGALFTILLPATEAEALPAPAMNEEPLSFTGRVLFMDDDEIILKVGEQLLQSFGLEVIPAPEGSIALKVFRDHYDRGLKFDLVILDLTIRGGMGGLEAFSAMKVIDPSIKAVVSSGYSSDPVMSNYKEYGFAYRLKKPYRLNELTLILKNIFG